MKEDENWIKATILYHLRNKKAIGAKHTHYDTLRRGFPKHLGKEIEEIAKQLIKEGLLITKPTSYGLQVSLNKDKLVEIEGIINHFLGREF
jgi:hypothetical protein